MSGPAELLSFHSTSPHFKTVIELRRLAAPQSVVEDEFDVDADHYLLRDADGPRIAMRVGRAARGYLDCEEFYPAHVMANRNVVCSAGRLVKNPAIKADVAAVRGFLLQIRREQVEQGVRLDVINVWNPMVPYYTPLGYQLVCGTAFTHPRLGTPSRVMFLAFEEYASGIKRCRTERACRRGQFGCEEAHTEVDAGEVVSHGALSLHCT